MRVKYGDPLFGQYGFFDAFNPTYRDATFRAQMGHIVAGVAWFDTDYLGIDQGPIVGMVENYRTGLLWNTFMANPEVAIMLQKLDAARPVN